jgi:hypothetical protein
MSFAERALLRNTLVRLVEQFHKGGECGMYFTTAKSLTCPIDEHNGGYVNMCCHFSQLLE